LGCKKPATANPKGSLLRARPSLEYVWQSKVKVVEVVVLCFNIMYIITYLH